MRRFRETTSVMVEVIATLPGARDGPRRRDGSAAWPTAASPRLGGIGDMIGTALKESSSKYNKGRRIDVVNQRLGYLVRSGDPDALDSIVPMAFGNLALDLVGKKQYGRLVSIHRGFYDSVPIANVTSEKKVVEVSKYYNTERLRPIYKFDGAPLFIMTGDERRKPRD